MDTIINKYKIEDQIKKLGFLNETEKVDFFQKIDVFYHVTQSEGMPMAVLEAMEYSLPCLVSPGCNLQKAWSENSVIQIEFERDEIIKFFENNNIKKRIELAKMNALKYLNTYHDWQEIAKKINLVYNKY